MIRDRNLSTHTLEGGVIAGLTAAAFNGPFGPVAAKAASYVRSVVINVVNKGAGGTATSFTVDVQKNGTSVLASAITVTQASVTNYSKADTDKVIVTSAPAGWSALPALSATAANLKCARGDAFDIVVTPNGTTTTAIEAQALVIFEVQ